MRKQMLPPLLPVAGWRQVISVTSIKMGFFLLWIGWRKWSSIKLTRSVQNSHHWSKYAKTSHLLQCGRFAGSTCWVGALASITTWSCWCCCGSVRIQWCNFNALYLYAVHASLSSVITDFWAKYSINQLSQLVSLICTQTISALKHQCSINTFSVSLLNHLIFSAIKKEVPWTVCKYWQLTCS